MNFASLVRIKLTSGTVPTLMQLIKLEIGQQRYPGLVEAVFYHLPDKPKELLFLTMWERLSALRRFEECFEKRSYREELKRRVEIIDYHTYRLVKEYRTVSASIGASQLRLTTFGATSQPQEEQLQELVGLLAKFREMITETTECEGVGAWLGQLLEESESAVARRNTTSQLSVLARYDFNSLESQRKATICPGQRPQRPTLIPKPVPRNLPAWMSPASSLRSSARIRQG